MQHSIEIYFAAFSHIPGGPPELLLIGVAPLWWWSLRVRVRARMIKGAALFLVAYIITILGGESWPAWNTLYSRLLVFASFAIVVVFQPTSGGR